MASGFKVKRRVWIFLLFALVSGAGWWVWTGSRINVAASPPVLERPAVRIATSQSEIGDEILRERARYLDPTPLFFPTEWNYGHVALREGMKRQPGQIFGLLPPKFVFDDQITKSYGATQNQLSGKLSDVATSENEAPFAGIGGREISSPVLVARDGFLEIENLKDGKTIVSQVLAEIPGVRSDFAPLEFLVSVSSSGLVADPILMNGSGREEMEVLLRTFLAKSFRVGERLAPGKYRVLIGP